MLLDFHSAEISSRKHLHTKATPDLHLTYSIKRGKPRVGIENDKHSLFLFFFIKHVKYTYLVLV